MGRNIPQRLRLLSVCFLAAFCQASALGQSDNPRATGEGQPQSVPDAVTQHPGFILGQRANLVIGARIISPMLVIVRSTDDYLDALAQWSTRAIFPILIDDGSDAAQENIARFVRAFEPEVVVRWNSATDAPVSTIRERTERAIRAAWDIEAEKPIIEAWRAIGYTPCAVIIASEQHAPWTAAAALGAARGLPIAWIDRRPGNPNAIMTPEEARSIADHASNLASDLGLSWRALADDIDGVAICLRIPGRIREQGGNNDAFLALTDVVGRHADGSRWAYAGWIFGDEATSAYQAMCSIFLNTNSAWLFDGYRPDFAPPYNLARAADAFEQSGWELTFTPAEAGHRNAWRQRTQRSIDAGFIHVNSAGHSNWFNLSDQRVYASDIPPLQRPAIVHFIHSFSAQSPANDTTIAARFLDHGAFAYVGSMHEPTLGAFLPLDNLMARLGIGMPLGAAARIDGAPEWRIQIFGDPLTSLVRRGERRVETTPPENTRPLRDLIREQLRDRNIPDAVRNMAMLGQDAQIIRLARATLADFTNNGDDSGLDREGIAQLARAALPVAFRNGDTEIFAQLYLALDPADAKRHDLRAMLWQIMRPELRGGDPTPLHVSLLRAHVRNDSMVEDAAELRSAIERVHGSAAVADFYTRLIDRAPNDRIRNQLTRDSPR